jgi:hypothetical protein
MGFQNYPILPIGYVATSEEVRIKAVLSALGERDETAEICRDRDGNAEPDPELRDTESVPLKESHRRVLPARGAPARARRLDR